MYYKSAIFVGAALIAVSSASGQPIAGHWEGQVTRGTATSPVWLDVVEENGNVEGAISFPNSGTLERPLDSIELSKQSTQFGYTNEGSVRSFEGRLNEDRLTGTFAVDDEKFDATFERVPFEKPYSEEDVVFYNGDVKIAGTIFIPKAAGRHPALVMLHGSGDNERNRYRFLADFYARLGVACLFMDKRGCGESGGDWRTVGFEPLARDGLAGLELLKQRNDIDPERIGLTGISQAGWVMCLAASLSDDVKYLVVNSASIETVEEEGYYDYMVVLADKGFSKEVLDQALTILKKNNEVTRTGEGYSELMEMVKAIRDVAWRKDFAFVAMPPKSSTRDHYRLIIDHDPVPIIEGLDIPILWNFGELDKSVDTAEGVAVLERIQSELDKNFTIHVYPGANHGIYVPPNPAANALPFHVYAPGYLENTAAWLRENALNP